MSPRVEEALAELQKYLQDQLPPDAAADALATLMAHPPDALMQRVGAWAVEQNRTRSFPIHALLVHALQKVYITGELGLLDREAVANYLDRVMTFALRICPAEEQELLRAELTDMRRSRTTTASLSALSPAPERLKAQAPPPMTQEEAQAAKHFSLIYDRLARQTAGAPGQLPVAADPQAIAQLLAIAATRSSTGQQFNDYLEQLRPLTGGKEGNVFVILGGGLPSWDIANVPAGAWKPPAQVGAMEKIIDLAIDPKVAMSRFNELVTAAVGKFNEGAIAAAVWMLSVAEDTIAEKKLEMATVDRIREQAVNEISAVQLRKYAENRSRHAAVKIVLEFFPTLHVDVLFQRLRGETRAEVRRTILGFLEAYGAIGRDAALTELEKELQRPDADTYYLRNLIYLLHRIARVSQDTMDRELAALSKASARGQNIYVVKEAATALGQIKSEGVVKLLTTRLAEFEAILLRGDTSMYPADEMQKLLDRVVGSLARIGTSAALLTVARHGMMTNPPLGDTRARLASLSQHDLSFDEPTVNILLKALREEIPGKLFGRLSKRQDATIRLIEALSGTRSEEIDECFRDIAERFADQDVGRAAAQVLDKWAPPKPAGRSEPAATLTGELEFFGLTSVMQSLADMRATGMLTLSNKQKQTTSKLVFLDGKFLNAQTGHLRGTDALYEALERPVSGTFAFIPYPPDRMKSENEPVEIMGLLLEGMRRNDELQRMLAIVPDNAILVKAGAKPTPHEEEKDAALVRETWVKASSGSAVGEWARLVPADTFRIRRLVTHWLDEGALVVDSAPPNAAVS